MAREAEGPYVAEESSRLAIDQNRAFRDRGTRETKGIFCEPARGSTRQEVPLLSFLLLHPQQPPIAPQHLLLLHSSLQEDFGEQTRTKLASSAKRRISSQQRYFKHFWGQEGVERERNRFLAVSTLETVNPAKKKFSGGKLARNFLFGVAPFSRSHKGEAC